MSIIIDKPDIKQTMELEGAVFDKSNYCCCLLHDERTASCSVNIDKQVFYCHGCGKGGDVIAFIRELKGLSFPETLRYFGLESDRPYKPDLEVERKRKFKKQFEEWEREYFDQIVTLYRIWNKVNPTLTPEQVELFADIYKQESIWEYHLGILSYVGSDLERNQEKLDLYRAYLQDQRVDQELLNRIDEAYEILRAAERRVIGDGI